MTLTEGQEIRAASTLSVELSSPKKSHGRRAHLYTKYLSKKNKEPLAHPKSKHFRVVNALSGLPIGDLANKRASYMRPSVRARRKRSKQLLGLDVRQPGL
jgi:hypothetical protein